MARNDDGEFELILGNRQLVSVFLIVVILLGAFFSMGYLVGRSSQTPAEASKIVVDNPQKPAGAQQTADTAAAPAPSKPAPVEPVESTRSTASAPSESKPVEEPKAEKPSPTKREEKAKREEPPPVETRPRETKPSTEEPRSGQKFLQVVATSRPDAEIVAETLGKKGFRTTVAPGPNDKTFRVLVGPVGDAAELAETRVRLEAAGFKPYVRQY